MFSYDGSDIGLFVSSANLDPLNGGVNHQYKAVKLNASTGKVDVVSAIGDVVFGVLQNQPRANQASIVRIDGVSKMIAGEAIALNAPVYLAVSGKCLASGAASGARLLGTALSSTAADGEHITVLMADQNVSTAVKA
jgi:hypothetical protein